MNPVLQNWFDRLEKDRKHLFHSLSGIPQNHFTHRPSPGKWSVSEILSHLFTAERLSLEYMKKKSLAMDKLTDAGLIEEVKMKFFILSQRLPLKYNAPRRVVEQTPTEIDLKVFADKWETLLGELKTFLNDLPEQHLRKKIYKHPIIGRLDAKLCLQSLHEHYRHHLPQIKRLL